MGLAVVLGVAGHTLLRVDAGLIVVGLAAAVAGGGLAFAYLWVRLRRLAVRLEEAGGRLCPNCGCFLEGLGPRGRCPECGAGFAIEEVTRLWRGHSLLRWFGFRGARPGRLTPKLATGIAVAVFAAHGTFLVAGQRGHDHGLSYSRAQQKPIRRQLAEIKTLLIDYRRRHGRYQIHPLRRSKGYQSTAPPTPWIRGKDGPKCSA